MKLFTHINRRLFIFLGIYTVVCAFISDLSEALHGLALIFNDRYAFLLVYALFALFAVFCRDKFEAIPKYKNRLMESVGFAALSLTVFCLPIVSWAGLADINLLSAYYFQLFLGLGFMFLSIFNLNFIKHFKRELSILMILFVSYSLIQFLVEAYWEYFSYVIMGALSYILPAFSNNLILSPEHYGVRMEEFRVFIGPTCTGIYSMVTFTALYVISLFFFQDIKRFDPFKTFLAFFLAMIAIFVLNILRIAVIIVVGAYISETLAIKVFHEYMSAVIFLGLFLLYLYLVIPRLLKR
jgi:exosortase/archaeosortase family protein